MNIQEAFDIIYQSGIKCQDCDYKTIHFEHDEPGYPPHRTRGCAYETSPGDCPHVDDYIAEVEEETNED